jgi:protein-S-isoprenylcysteine O-methyltransferase Ste14
MAMSFGLPSALGLLRKAFQPVYDVWNHRHLMAADSPGVHFPPPFLFILVFFAGWMLRNSLPRVGSEPVALILAAIAVLLAAWAMGKFARAKTSLIPNQPAKAFVTDGPYRFSRNPMYVSLSIAYASASLLTASLTSLLLLPLAVLLIDRLVIAREERYLARRFGEEYREYCTQVRRWL